MNVNPFFRWSKPTLWSIQVKQPPQKSLCPGTEIRPISSSVYIDLDANRSTYFLRTLCPRIFFFALFSFMQYSVFKKKEMSEKFIEEILRCPRLVGNNFILAFMTLVPNINNRHVFEGTFDLVESCFQRQWVFSLITHSTNFIAIYDAWLTICNPSMS